MRASDTCNPSYQLTPTGTCTVTIYTFTCMGNYVYPNMQGLPHMHCLKETTDEEQNSSPSLLHIEYLCSHHRYSILRNWDWNPRIHRVPMYVNLPVIKWPPLPATCGVNGYSKASCLGIDGFMCCALHGANRIYGDVWYEPSGVRYCLPLLSCALWLSRRKRRSSRGIAHDDSAQTRC